MAPPSIAARLRAELGAAMSVDQARLRTRIDRLQRRGVASAEIEAVSRAVAASCARAAARAAAVPQVSYAPELPISERRDDIAQAIREHPVVIVCGATGSGKTTQLPKICLELERGVRGLIGHTQPRRIAARSVAARLAQELAVPLGSAVGFKVRFTDRTGPDAYIKVMTDGILLAETQHDRLLAAYDTIILDEAHERSLNIDFLLGYLKQLLPRRPDLKLLITSATLDAERFARHFGSADRPAPVIQVSGRTYPVELRYRPLAGDEGDDEEPLEEGIVAATEDLWRAGPGDILVFLPGEREIRETADLLRASLARRPYASNVEVLPLYARLSIAEQQRVFAPSGGRRIVLATNVAETSLTVPGIHYVIDSGMARVRRYSLRNKVTLLQIEKIAQAAAEQRAGRCGRVAAGVCVRLYSEEDFAARPRFTDPEILRSSLAAVILRMAALDLGEAAAFPFLEAPGSRAIADGYQLLHELSAVDARRELSPLGRELAQLPLDPRIGRMILAARDNGCLAEVLVIASALAVPDPRERPLEKQQAADQAHLRFRDERSDFLGLLALWQFLADALAEGLSHRRLVERCRAHFVSYLRLVEWRDLHRALSDQVQELGWRWSDALPETIDAARYALIHRSLLAGLLSNVGRKSDTEEHYLGARGIKFFLHPGSGLAKKGPPWVLAAELTETSRLYARCAAKIEPEWVEAVAGDLVEKAHFDPHWDNGRGEVVASERVTLFGLPLVPRRRVSYGAIAPAAAREVFLREALVAGELDSPAPFLAHNRDLIAAVAELEHKSRRQDVLVDDETIYAFYTERVGEGISTRVAFDRWRREAEAADPRRLFLTRELLMRHAAAAVTAEQFPEALDLGGAKLPLQYRFDPGDPLDGLTLTVPLALLNRLDAARLSWLVPGMVREKVAWYVKALPKAWRSRLPPAPEVVTAFVEQPQDPRPLRAALRAFVAGRVGAALPAEVWSGAVPPPHLRFNLRVVDAAGRELAAGRDLGALRAQLGDAAQLDFAAAGPGFERKGIRSWDFGDLPETLAVERDGHRLSGYPALVRDGDSVALKLLDTREAAEAATRAAVIALMKIPLKDALRRWEKGGTGFVQAALVLKPALATEGLLADVLSAVCDRAFLGDDPAPRSEHAFAEQVKRARVRLPAVAESAFALIASIAAAYHALAQQLAAVPSGARRLAVDVAAQRDLLLAPGFFATTPWKALVHLPRYLQALERRLVKYPDNPARDARQAQAVAALWERYREREAALRERGRHDPGLDAFRWLLEELKVSLFAQELRTPIPVSYKRLEKAWKAVSGG
jgi:ATP-dependent helicase HrpA